jgi:hypothetical protein
MVIVIVLVKESDNNGRGDVNLYARAHDSGNGGNVHS